MRAERRLTEASRSLQEFVATRPVPPPPDSAPTTGFSRRPGVVALALAVVLALVVGAVLRLGDDPGGPIDDEAVSALPLGEFEQWTYTVTDVAGGDTLEPVTIEARALREAMRDGRLVWPLPLFEPWRPPEPGSCVEAVPLVLPSRPQLLEGGTRSQEIRATCDDVEVVGAARLSWGRSATLTVPAGDISVIEVAISVTGFQDPFPLDMSLWLDPEIGVVRLEVIGASPGPVRHTRADLVTAE